VFVSSSSRRSAGLCIPTQIETRLVHDQETFWSMDRGAL
jgi:hypothetical protein